MRTLDWTLETKQHTAARWSYTLLVEDIQVDGFQCESYGVRVNDLISGECAQVRHVTVDPKAVLELLGTLSRYAVTPTTLSDVVEDWLAR